MEKYSKAVSEMYSQFEKREAHQMGKYIGKIAYFFGGKSEVVGYSRNGLADEPLLIVDGSKNGWDRSALEPSDVVFKECEKYWYVSVDDLNRLEDYD